MVLVLLHLRDTMLGVKENGVTHAFVVLLGQTAFLRQKQIVKIQNKYNKGLLFEFFLLSE